MLPAILFGLSGLAGLAGPAANLGVPDAMCAGVFADMFAASGSMGAMTIFWIDKVEEVLSCPWPLGKGSIGTVDMEGIGGGNAPAPAPVALVVAFVPRLVSAAGYSVVGADGCQCVSGGRGSVLEFAAEFGVQLDMNWRTFSPTRPWVDVLPASLRW